MKRNLGPNMRLNEFNERNIDKEQIDALVDDDCSISASSHSQMFRGTNYQTSAFVGEIRMDRTTRNSSENDTMAFDLLMEAAGLPFRKSNTLSVTVDKTQAKEYGSQIYRIYPFNDAVYLYSGKFSDLIDLTHEIVDEFQEHVMNTGATLDEFSESTLARMMKEFIEDNHQSYIDRFDLHSTDDPSDFSMGDAAGEVLVLGHKYLAITTDRNLL